MNADRTVARARGRARQWLGRYASAEAAAILGAVLAASVADWSGAAAAATAFAGAAGEAIAFYAVIIVRDARTRPARRIGGRALVGIIRNLMLEFGPAELLDTLAVRPLAMYLGPVLVGNLTMGVILGKIAADAVFYTLAIFGHEMGRSRTAVGRETSARGVPAARPGPAAVGARWPDASERAVDPLSPAVLDSLPYPTPYLLMDLDRVARAYRTMADALGVDAIHYAMKCNSDPRVLATLHALGCRFEVASHPELTQLVGIGVDPADVLYSNPVKPADHIRRAYRAGCWRFAADGIGELTKLAQHAPGAAVYVRLRGRTTGTSAVPSEGKFGVGPRQALALLAAAVGMGLRPYGLTFHVGSQMTQPSAWAEATVGAGAIISEAAKAGVRLEMLDIGGGFPARYSDPVADLGGLGSVIRRAIDLLPYRPFLVAEPGRALVAEAGVLVSTVIGTAVRGDRKWVHLDVGAFNGMMEALETRNTLIYPLSDSRRESPRIRCHLTGPSCDSQDTLLFDVPLSEALTEGDRVYIGTAGAYTTAYASRFNGFDLPETHHVSARRDGDRATVALGARTA